jgi:hypothetical protein
MMMTFLWVLSVCAAAVVGIFIGLSCEPDMNPEHVEWD